MYQKDVGYLSECVLHYLRDLPSPLIPACIYPHLKTAVTTQQQILQQAAGTSHVRHVLLCVSLCHKNLFVHYQGAIYAGKKKIK